MTRTTPRMLAALAGTMLLLLAGCGGSEEAPDVTRPSAEPPAATATPAPTTPAPSASTPEPTPTATTPTAAKPMGKLVDYETTDEDGATIAVAADTSKLTGAPADFKTFIAGQLGKTSPDEGCTEPPQIYVSRIDTGGWARGGHFIPQCGGYATLWAKSDGAWRDVWSGQSLVDCTTLERFGFPARVAGDSCLNGEDAVAYSG